ncbi:MAG: hypothetical protein GY751_18065 [Bacteroidetes bacterium]|nr:hypothetical protein [Bacteroidota bacterium]
MIIDGVNIPQKLEIESINLSLQGAGARSVLFFKPYILAFYSVNAFKMAEEVIISNDYRGIRLIVNSDMITGSLLAKGLKDGLGRTHYGKIPELQPVFETLFAKFEGWPIHKGDVVHIFYHQEAGIQFFYNDALQFEEKSEGFAEAIFGIWFSNDFPDSGLQKALIGQ